MITYNLWLFGNRLDNSMVNGDLHSKIFIFSMDYCF